MVTLIKKRGSQPWKRVDGPALFCRSAMAGSDVLATIALKVPRERFLFRHRDHARAVEQFMAPMFGEQTLIKTPQKWHHRASQRHLQGTTLLPMILSPSDPTRFTRFPIPVHGSKSFLFRNKTPRTDRFLALSSVCYAGQE